MQHILTPSCGHFCNVEAIIMITIYGKSVPWDVVSKSVGQIAITQRFNIVHVVCRKNKWRNIRLIRRQYIILSLYLSEETSLWGKFFSSLSWWCCEDYPISLPT